MRLKCGDLWFSRSFDKGPTFYVFLKPDFLSSQPYAEGGGKRRRRRRSSRSRRRRSERRDPGP